MLETVLFLESHQTKTLAALDAACLFVFKIKLQAMQTVYRHLRYVYLLIVDDGRL